MSKETSQWLNHNVLIGFTEQRGHAWHYQAAHQGDEPNHYPHAVPVADVQRRLFNWVAEPGPVLLEGRHGLRTAPGRLAVTASDNGDLLGLFTQGYAIHQYQDWLLDRVDLLLDSHLQIGSAGLLDHRKRAWVSIEMPENITTPEGVEFRPRLVACTSHDGSLNTTYKRVVTNIVCDNTMAAGLRETGQEVKIKHTRHSKLDILDARDALALVCTVAEDFAAEVRHLCQTTVTDRQWREFLTAHAPIPETNRGRTNAINHRRDLSRLWEQDPRVAPWQHTGWGVVQAVNTHLHHGAVIRNVSRAERNLSRAVDGSVTAVDRDTVATLHRVLASA
ncbi:MULTISPECIES: DUF932 domain-containing protein [unclassified Crossiella]|uniref:DUF932 domain-containing protein n=1 Tax=unclassified Crossiella TaxID=2620835 RepID=UPI002000107C|nr:MULTISPECIES: DUF932 domain-containing protein [unclassified Crossiella]MCK2240025.1 DUF932 domain-containing protein [Crossiella sp. S99.2]MCK2252733.1 DUF932 domain-containing protein [Crossiella sp. S99.1]